MIENVKCPDCDGPMTSRKNKSTGQRFWGCKKFPQCRGVRDTDGKVRTRQSVRDYDDEPASDRSPSDHRRDNDRARWRHQ